MIALLVIALPLLRRMRSQRQHDRARFAALWEEKLYARMDDPKAPLPQLQPGELLLFLPLWLRIIGYVRGESEAFLIDAARQLDVKPATLRLLASRNRWKRLLAMRAAGILRLTKAIPALKKEILRRDPGSAEIAISALFRIDSDIGTAVVRTQLSELVWSASFVARLLAPAGPHALALLSGELANAPPRRVLRLLRVIDALANSDALPILRSTVATGRNPEEIAVALRTLGRFGSAEDRETARGMLAHAAPLVRMQAAACLGHIGAEADYQALAPLLHDRDWWVRYRAAGAIASLLHSHPPRLLALINTETDPDARAMLGRVAAEAGLHV